MQTIRRAQVIAIVVLAVVVGGLAGACSIAGSGGSGPLVTVTMRGGNCLNPPCESTVYLERDGRVHSADKPPNDLGTVPADQVAAIDAAIRLTDFAELRTHPFTGECPVNFDGQEVVYEFSAPTGIERIESCQVEVDPGAPVFMAVATALGAYVPLPVT
jgi:hypothetical protein